MTTFLIISPLFWVEKLATFALLLQTVEFVIVRKSYADSGIWSWPHLVQEYRHPLLRKIATCLFSYRNFLVVIIVRGLVAAVLLFNIIPSSPILFAFLLLTTLAIMVRWRGPFNGGSDSMFVILLTALLINSLGNASDTVTIAAAWYITFHTCSSYFLAGVAKLKNPHWRNGSLLPLLFDTSIYDVKSIQKTMLNPMISTIVSWVIVLFEVSFPLAILKPQIATFYIATGMLFHLSNIYLFGLSRFFWVWVATYPALYYCSQ